MEAMCSKQYIAQHALFFAFVFLNSSPDPVAKSFPPSVGWVLTV